MIVVPKRSLMKLYALVVYYKDGTNAVRPLKGAYDLQSFSFFQRGSVREFIAFTGKIIVERSALSTRSTVKEREFLIYTYIRADGLSGVLVADAEYPQRVAFTVLTKACAEFEQHVAPSCWPTATEASVVFSGLDVLLARYQDPHQADGMTRIQDDLDETKVILHETIQKVLERGEKLDDLVERSEGLSQQSKLFYTQARKMNKCCSWT